MTRRRISATLITDALESPLIGLRRRQRRYIAMMSLRIVCLIGAAVVAAARPPATWLWVSICVVGAVIVPWMAVLIANDRPPREQRRFLRHNSTQLPAGHVEHSKKVLS